MFKINGFLIDKCVRILLFDLLGPKCQIKGFL